jgi:arylsulfatase A-like enzyme
VALRRFPADGLSYIDLFATALDIADAPMPDRPHSAQSPPVRDEPLHEYTFAEVGRRNYDSLTRKFPDYEPPQEQIGPLQSVRDDTHKLIVSTDGHAELYRWRDDPEESNDISESNPEKTAELREVLRRETADMTSETANEQDVSESVKDTWNISAIDRLDRLKQP